MAKTEIEILNKYFPDGIKCEDDRVGIIIAMAEYASQFQSSPKWQLCPKCNGQGMVEKPTYVAGDVHQWISTASVYVCDVCNGAKVLQTLGNVSPQAAENWVPPTDQQISDWYVENIDFDCSASSAIYKFILWLKSSAPVSPVPVDVDYDLEKLYEWLMDENRKRAITAFTSGVARNIASQVEFMLSKHYPVPVKEEGDERDHCKSCADKIDSEYYKGYGMCPDCLEKEDSAS